ncbi:MAG: peptidyl-prolyl cis-trans isomerase [Eubacterium sp.]|nr:peptidyl-prolyl cis-trans isomerase [Eubacterium sp.]
MNKLVHRNNRGGKTARIVFLILSMVFAALALGGCSSKDSEDEGDIVFNFAKNPITLGEVYVYAETVIEDYESTYGKDVWNMTIKLADGTEENMEVVTRKDIIDTIVRVKVLNAISKNYGVELTDAEIAAEKNRADIFFNRLTDDQLEKMQITENLVENVFCENLLAQRVYEKLVEDAGIEISDEEARETTFYDMFFAFYSEDEDKNIIEITDIKKQEQYNKALQAYKTLVSPVSEESGNIESLAAYYNLEFSQYYTMTPKEIKEQYGEDIYEDIYQLEDGSYSLIIETEYGYHLFYMKYLTDPEATAARKKELTIDAEDKYFASKFPGWQRTVDAEYSYAKSVNMDVYNKISFK